MTKRFVKVVLLVLAAVSGAFSLFAAQKAFEKVPAAALAALAEARGKAFRHGIVFVNGHYLAPPYVVSRYGTALAVNGVQVSGPIIPWSAFLATQSAGRPAAGEAADSIPTPPPAAPAVPDPAPAPAVASSLDDLFGDPAPAVPVAATPSAQPPVASPDGKFAPNAKSNILLRRINAMRTDLDRGLRDDQFFFFSTRYARVNGNSKTALELLRVLPEALRDATDATDLQLRLRAAGITYLGFEVCDDLIAHRIDYPALIERRRKMQEEADQLRALQDIGGVL